MTQAPLPIVDEVVMRRRFEEIGDSLIGQFNTRGATYANGWAYADAHIQMCWLIWKTALVSPPTQSGGEPVEFRAELDDILDEDAPNKWVWKSPSSMHEWLTIKILPLLRRIRAATPIASKEACGDGVMTKDEMVLAAARRIAPIVFSANYTGRTEDIARAALEAALTPNPGAAE